MKTKLKKTTTPKGYEHWEIDYDNGLKSFNLSDIKLHLEPEQEKGYIKGEILSERLKEKSMNGAVLDYLLEHTDKIPTKWKGKYVYFWGTIYRNSGSYLHVRYLSWGGGGWRWCCSWLEDDWNSSNPAAVSRKSFALESKSLSSDTLNLETRIKALEERLNRYNLK